MDIDELDIELRTPAVAARRCIVLASLMRRLAIESLAADRPDEGLAAEAFDLRAWLHTENLWTSLDEAESTCLDRPLGALTDDEMATIAWQTEGLAVLAWALRLAELAPIGDMGQIDVVLGVVPAPWQAVDLWIKDAVLLPEPEITRERDRAEVFEWRASIEIPRRRSTGQERTDFDSAVADVSREAAQEGLTPTQDDDFPISGVPLSSIDDENVERLAALAEERLRALNWLCGFGESWDRVPLDV